MNVEHIELYQVALPLNELWRTACSEETAVQGVVVRMVVGGQEGWAETAPHRGPLYSPEWANGVFCVLRDWLGPMIHGQTIETAERIHEILHPIKGNHFAKAGLDVAWWDAHARRQGKPLWRIIGGTKRTVEVGADIGVKDTIDELLVTIAESVEAGFKRVKLKFRPGWDVDMVRAVRGTFPDLVMHVDCNSGFTLDDVAMFRALDDFGLAMIEQPLGYDDLVDHAKLQAQIDTPICLDETIVSLDRARHAIELGSCRWMNLKIGRPGGLTNAIAIHDLCEAHGISCWVGNMLESALGQAPALALATLPNIKYPSDVFPSSRFYEADLAEPGHVLSGPSLMDAPKTPGLGQVPHPDRLKAVTVNHAVVEPGQP